MVTTAAARKPGSAATRSEQWHQDRPAAHGPVDGYHLGLVVTIALLAAGVVVSFVTLRPRAAQPITGPITVDELAARLMVADEMAP